MKIEKLYEPFPKLPDGVETALATSGGQVLVARPDPSISTNGRRSLRSGYSWKEVSEGNFSRGRLLFSGGTSWFSEFVTLPVTYCHFFSNFESNLSYLILSNIVLSNLFRGGERLLRERGDKKKGGYYESQ